MEGEFRPKTVDFLLVHGPVPLPVEVKSGAAGKLRSLHRFVEMCPAAKTAIRLYRGRYALQQAGSNVQYRLANIPYYHASKIDAYADMLCS
ncbi:MAG: hypothetical protein DRP64_08400 [Verrucomicrobia bacterium]|nr:MAG: hypothetical protein DRP64_08400 [Verrucomicrobiota bacterium]